MRLSGPRHFGRGDVRLSRCRSALILQRDDPDRAVLGRWLGGIGLDLFRFGLADFLVRFLLTLGHDDFLKGRVVPHPC
ncbi:hypothetical protein SPHINGOAX6_20279 [Sphingomonas sp. AX6]|nr:hypothetical protein SPHINGOAX6_20279 [Sphingomonas sp. AX6]